MLPPAAAVPATQFDRRSAGPAVIILLALWCALLTGLVEMTLLMIKKLYLGQIVRVGTDAVWMAPVADAAFFLAPALVLALVAAWRPTRRVLSLAIWTSAFLS